MSEIAIDAVQFLDRVRRLADLIREEQDLLLVDRNIGGRLLPGESYFPIEPCLASVQVKSTLTRTQIRDATVNCISIKRLFGWPLVHEDQSDREYDKLCYAVFSYGSRSELDRLADVLNDELAQVSRHLWPNMFYVLGKGLLIPGDDRGVPFDSSTMFTGPRFRTVKNVGAEPALPASEAYAFLWFLSNIIDHCMEQRGQRESPNLQRFLTRMYARSEVEAGCPDSGRDCGCSSWRCGIRTPCE